MIRLLFFLAAIFVQLSPVFSADEKDQALSLQEITQHIRKNVQLEGKNLGFRSEEADTYYQMIRKLVELPVGELEQGGREFLGERFHRKFPADVPRELPVYSDMHFHMQDYHGKPVILRGHTQRIIPLDIDPPVSGVTRLYEIWLYTSDSQHNPAVIISPGLPEEFKIGDEIQSHLKVKGVMFKKYLYNAQDRVRFAPLILAGELSYDPPVFKTLFERRDTLVVVSIFSVLFLVITFNIFKYMHKSSRSDTGQMNLPEKIDLQSPESPNG